MKHFLHQATETRLHLLVHLLPTPNGPTDQPTEQGVESRVLDFKWFGVSFATSGSVGGTRSGNGNYRVFHIKQDRRKQCISASKNERSFLKTSDDF